MPSDRPHPFIKGIYSGPSLRHRDGTILDPRDGSAYDAQMEFGPDGQNLSVRGYLGIPFLALWMLGQLTGT
jgi:uncharacterized protein (DUF2147 family)